MAKPEELGLSLIQRAIAFYEKLIKDFPNCRGLDESLQYWKDQETSYHKNHEKRK